MLDLPFQDYLSIIGFSSRWEDFQTNRGEKASLDCEKRLTLAKSKEEVDSILIKTGTTKPLEIQSSQGVFLIHPLIPVLRSRNKDAIVSVGYNRFEVELSKEWAQKKSSLALNAVYSLNPVLLKLVEDLRPDYYALIERVFIAAHKDIDVMRVLAPIAMSHFKELDWAYWPSDSFKFLLPEFSDLINNDDCLSLAKRGLWEKLNEVLEDGERLESMPTFKKWEMCCFFSQHFQKGVSDEILLDLSEKVQKSFPLSFFEDPANFHRSFMISVEMSLLIQSFEHPIKENWFGFSDSYALALNSSGRMALLAARDLPGFFKVKALDVFVDAIEKEDRPVWFQNFYEQTAAHILDNSEVLPADRLMIFRQLHQGMIEKQLVSSQRIPFLITKSSSVLLNELNDTLTQEIIGVYSNNLIKIKSIVK